jgi:P27 family predicted phage terminase small subunit
MRPGRKPNPNLLELSKARPGGRRQRYAHDFPPLSGPPDYLSQSEKALFRQVGEAVPHGLLVAIDTFLLTAFCQHLELHRRAMAELAELDRLDLETDSKTVKAHPLMQIAQTQARLLLDMADSLCLTGLSRQRLKLPVPPNDTWDRLA